MSDDVSKLIDNAERVIAGGTPDEPDAESPVDLATKYVQHRATDDGVPALRRWNGDWYTWSQDRGCYSAISDETLDSWLYRALKLRKRAIVADVRHALIAVDEVLIDGVELGSWLDGRNGADPLDVAVCPNGIVDLATGAITPTTPRYFTTCALGVTYDASAPEPTAWLAFLRQLWPDDTEAIAALQEWFGLMLSPDTSHHKILLMIGPPRSGKGTIARVMTGMLGKSGVAAPTLASMATNFGLAPLIGRSAAIVGDARLSGRSDVSAVVERLLSISGEDSIQIDRKHREPYNGTLPVRFSIISNELPRFTDASGALASRMILLKLARSFLGHEDRGLTTRLLGELPGILNWSIEGWRRLRERGHFVQPASSGAMVEELSDLASPVAAWLRACCTAAPEQWSPVDDCYSSFAMWCSRAGLEKFTPSKATFGRDLRAAVADLKTTQRRIAGRPTHGYVGIGVVPIASRLVARLV